MKNKYYNSIFNFRFILFTFFVVTIFISFYLDEDSSGGAKQDHLVTKEFIILFSQNFFSSIEIYDPRSNPHLPFFYILLGKLSNFINLEVLRFLHLLICLSLPLIFYKILKLRFKYQNRDVLFLISTLIFLSPYYRSSAIWLTNDNLTLIFFSLSVYYFFKTEKFKNDNLADSIKCFLFLIFTVYLRQNFFLFFIFYFYYLFINSKVKNVQLIIFLSLIFALPGLFYLFYFQHIQFYLKAGIVNNRDNLLNSLIFLNIILFYLIPFLISKSALKKILHRFSNHLKEICFLILIVLTINYFISDYVIFVNEVGGGVFYKLFVKLLDIPELFVLFAILSLVLFFCFFDIQKENYILLLILFFLYPLHILYQKYFDPLFLIMMFSLLSFKHQEEKKFFNTKFLTIPILYFSSFYIFALYHYH